MKALTKLSSLAAGVILVGAAGSAHAQSCFNCNQEANVGNHQSFSCVDGSDFASCYTEEHFDPNTCEYYYSCVTTQCMNDCTSSMCDPNATWDIMSGYDLNNFTCWAYGFACPAE
jgi:hypothetical protein